MKWIAVAVSVALIVCTASASERIYEDDRISVAVPSRWSQMRTANQDVIEYRIPSEGSCLPGEPLGLAFSDRRYALYLLTHSGQTSGIIGGRFLEIAEFVAPWTNLEVGGCRTKEVTTKVTDVLARVDLYFDTRHATTDELSLCGNPSAKGVLWYGSYFTQRCSAGSDDCCCEDPAHPEEGNDGYFLDFPSLAHTQDKSGWDKSKRQMAFTLTFRTSNPDNLPHKGDRHLRKFLNQASEVVRTIKYKAGVYW